VRERAAGAETGAAGAGACGVRPGAACGRLGRVLRRRMTTGSHLSARHRRGEAERVALVDAGPTWAARWAVKLKRRAGPRGKSWAARRVWARSEVKRREKKFFLGQILNPKTSFFLGRSE
jgi:hypothetical protein